MTPVETNPAASSKGNGLVKALLSSMWGYWLLLLAVSFGIAGAIYFIWLRGHI
jgi:hypothetical protein